MVFHTSIPRNSQDISAVIRVKCVEALANLKTVDFHSFTRKPREAPRPLDKLELKGLRKNIHFKVICLSWHEVYGKWGSWHHVSEIRNFTMGTCYKNALPLLFSLGFRVRDMKADNSLPVIGQGFKELCNLPTSFTLSWNSRVKLDAGWASVVDFESFQRPSQTTAADCFLTGPLYTG